MDEGMQRGQKQRQTTRFLIMFKLGSSDSYQTFFHLLIQIINVIKDFSAHIVELSGVYDNFLSILPNIFHDYMQLDEADRIMHIFNEFNENILLVCNMCYIQLTFLFPNNHDMTIEKFLELGIIDINPYTRYEDISNSRFKRICIKSTISENVIESLKEYFISQSSTPVLDHLCSKLEINSNSPFY